MEKICKGKKRANARAKISVNDDLETLLEKIQLGKEPDDDVDFYFLPKLTEHELKLVERKDEDFMMTFGWEMDADVDKAEMAASESDSKYVYRHGWRETFTIENQ